MKINYISIVIKARKQYKLSIMNKISVVLVREHNNVTVKKQINC